MYIVSSICIMVRQYKSEVLKMYTQAQNKATQKYNAKAYDELKIRVPKGRKEMIQKYCLEHGLSVNKLVCELLQEKTNIIMHN